MLITILYLIGYIIVICIVLGVLMRLEEVDYLPDFPIFGIVTISIVWPITVPILILYPILKLGIWIGYEGSKRILF